MHVAKEMSLMASLLPFDGTTFQEVMIYCSEIN